MVLEKCSFLMAHCTRDNFNKTKFKARVQQSTQTEISTKGCGKIAISRESASTFKITVIDTLENSSKVKNMEKDTTSPPMVPTMGFGLMMS